MSPLLSLLLVAALILVGCRNNTLPSSGDDNSNSGGDIVEVVVLAERTTLSPGETIQARAEARTSEGSTVADARFDWSSSDPDVLTVDGQGKITAVSPGAARVKATAVGTSISGTLDFRVSEAPPPPAGSVAQVVLGPERGTLPVGASFQLLAEAFDTEGRLLEGVAFQWSSSDEGVLSVDAAGRMTAHAEGSATVRVEADGKAATADFEVEPQSDAPRSASWEPVEPIAYPRVYDLAVDAAGREIAVSSGDLHRRDGPGTPWVRTFANRIGSSITPHPSEPDELWMVYNNDVYVSRNGGLYFELALDGDGIDRVVFHPLDENVLYVLSEGYARYRSADGGASWSALAPDCSDASASTAWSPVDPGDLVALHGDGVLCRTRDGGATWEAATLPDGDGFTGLSFGPDGALWVMDQKYESGVGWRYRLHRSDDLGDTWTETFATDDYDFRGRVYVHPADTNVVFVEPSWGDPLWFSTDDGASFTKTSTRLRRVDHDPGDPAMLYGVSYSSDASGDYPVLRSDDYGQTWNPTGVLVESYYNYYGARFASGRTYLLTDRGLWVSDEGGVSFTRIGENRGLAPQWFYYGDLVAIDGLEPSTLWVRANDGSYRSADAGEAWQVWGSGAPEQLARSPYDPQVWYGANVRGDVLRSTDGGQTWAWMGRVPYQTYWAPRLYPTSTPDLLYALAGGGVYRSSDGGATWEPRNQGLEHVPRYAGELGFELMVHPDDPAQLFLATGHEGVYRSDDGGGSWYPINRGLANLEVSQLCLAADGQTLFAGARDGGVYVSLDLGGTWSFARTIGHYRVTDLACDPSDADVVYAATYGGVYKSTDKGSTWALASDGLTTPFVEQILVSQDGSRLYLCTSATGIFRGVPSDTEGAVFRTQGLEALLQRILMTRERPEAP